MTRMDFWETDCGGTGNGREGLWGRTVSIRDGVLVQFVRGRFVGGCYVGAPIKDT